MPTEWNFLIFFIIQTPLEIPMALIRHSALIIDALLDPTMSLTSLTNTNLLFKTINLIKWVNTMDKPILSIDIPAGLTDIQGPTTSSDTNDIISPWYTLCLGAPTSTLTNPKLVGEVYLGDIGIPATLWSKVGMEFNVPFGTKFITRLQF